MSRPSISPASDFPFQRFRKEQIGLRLLNYLGQLRPYSYADLWLLLAAGGAGAIGFAQASALWFAFLIYLEWRHRDRGRRPWPWAAWAGLGLFGLLLGPSPAVACFAALCVLYASKKAFPRLALISPLINGLLKASLLFVATGVAGPFALLVAVLTGIRNLAGDMRDVVKDRAENVETIPVRLGFKHDHPVLYPAALAATSAVWVIYGDLPVWVLALAWLVELTTYRLTPR
ncbi:MAG TPA: hypothetical protein VFM94_10795 [Solirubrobacterales bacterium]|nr:hypothetical protein [Solirubrobacterales bacterium]